MLFEDSTITNQRKRQVINEFSTLLNKGWTFTSIIFNLFNIFKSIHSLEDKLAMRKESILHMFNSFIRNKDIYSSNLVVQNRMYYHKELKIMNGPKVVDFDYDTGVMVSKQQEYFLETVASYTYSDLVDYLLSKNIIDTKEYTRNRLLGLMKFYVERYGIEEVLFMVEAGVESLGNSNNEHKKLSMREFESGYSKAIEYLKNMKTNCSYSGGDKLVPKKRMLFS